jgi:hypothetical protein
MRYDPRTTFLMVSALVLALAAMLASPASARPIEGIQSGPAYESGVRPDDKSGLQGVGSVANPQPVTPNADTPGAPAAPQSGDGFDWRDASIGLGAAMAAVLLTTMVVLATRGRHRGKVATP